MNPTLLALYGLKWNPFSPELPTESVFVSPRVENFCWRIEQALIREGGFAMIHGDPGSGKSVALSPSTSNFTQRCPAFPSCSRSSRPSRATRTASAALKQPAVLGKIVN